MTPRERRYYERGKRRAVEEGLMLTGLIALGLFAFKRPEVLAAILNSLEARTQSAGRGDTG